jgi:hypothetical protein
MKQTLKEMVDEFEAEKLSEANIERMADKLSNDFGERLKTAVSEENYKLLPSIGDKPFCVYEVVLPSEIYTEFGIIFPKSISTGEVSFTKLGLAVLNRLFKERSIVPTPMPYGAHFLPKEDEFVIKVCAKAEE